MQPSTRSNDLWQARACSKQALDIFNQLGDERAKAAALLVQSHICIKSSSAHCPCFKVRLPTAETFGVSAQIVLVPRGPWGGLGQFHSVPQVTKGLWGGPGWPRQGCTAQGSTKIVGPRRAPLAVGCTLTAKAAKEKPAVCYDIGTSCTIWHRSGAQLRRGPRWRRRPLLLYLRAGFLRHPGQNLRRAMAVGPEHKNEHRMGDVT